MTLQTTNEMPLEDTLRNGPRILPFFLLKMKKETLSTSIISHANAYDTLIRPIQSVINSVADGRTDNDGMMDDFMRGHVRSHERIW